MIGTKGENFPNGIQNPDKGDSGYFTHEHGELYEQMSDSELEPIMKEHLEEFLVMYGDYVDLIKKINSFPGQTYNIDAYANFGATGYHLPNNKLKSYICPPRYSDAKNISTKKIISAVRESVSFSGLSPLEIVKDLAEIKTYLEERIKIGETQLENKLSAANRLK